jgi:serine/threonine-protein kinase
MNPGSTNDRRAGPGPGLQLGPYRILGRLDQHRGDNHRGPLYKAVHVGLERTVALKVLDGTRGQNQRQRQSFLEEIRRAAGLIHPNLVATFDTFESAAVLVLAMEYVKGTDLERLVREKGRLAIAVACGFIRQAALGLGHLYQHGLVHRNLQPKNLLIAEVQPTLSNPDLELEAPAVSAGTVKLLHLGLAWRGGVAGAAVEREPVLTRDGRVLSSPDYLAPEQIDYRHTADIRSDLYSLGCTLYFALAGWPPFPRGSALEKLFYHHVEEPTPLERLRPEVPAGLARIVHRLLAKRPADRYQTPAELAAALLPFCSATAVPRVPVPPSAAQVPTPAEVSVADTEVDLKVSKRSLPWRRGWPFLAFLAVAAVLGLGAAILLRLLHIFG